MDAFLSRKRPRLNKSDLPQQQPSQSETTSNNEDSTDFKLALLLSMFPDIAQETLLDILVSHGGSVEAASSTISTQPSSATTATKKRALPGLSPGIQTSLSSHIIPTSKDGSAVTKKPLTKKGKTLHLYSPEDIAAHTPCSIIHNFLPAEQANALLVELLDESKHFSRYKFQLFDRTVQSPHTASTYVSTPEEYRQQTSEYTYGGTYRTNVRQITPYMREVAAKVQQVVNEEIQNHTQTCYPGGKKLKYQSPKTWMPNAAFVNCYDGPAESVGYHSDELTYLGPHPVIGSLSLGVEREFRIRRIVAQDDDVDDDYESEKSISSGNLNHQTKGNSLPKKSQSAADARADAQGQIAIHLPHNSLLVMHAEMQEEWKHAITPAQAISPHPVSGNRRINITYRWYREALHPRNTPRCQCGMHTILRCVQRKRETRGRYMWMCYAGFAPGKQGCSFFQWADFDDDGEPLWKKDQNDEAPTLSNFVETV